MILRPQSVVVRKGSEIQIVSVQTLRWFTLRSFDLGCPEPWLYGADHARGDFVLERKDVREVAVVTLGPDVSAACRVDELPRYSDPMPALRMLPSRT